MYSLNDGKKNNRNRLIRYSLNDRKRNLTEIGY